jgi:hypothetical protein
MSPNMSNEIQILESKQSIFENSERYERCRGKEILVMLSILSFSGLNLWAHNPKGLLNLLNFLVSLHYPMWHFYHYSLEMSLTWKVLGILDVLQFEHDLAERKEVL